MQSGTRSSLKLLAVLGYAALAACYHDWSPTPPGTPPAATYTVGGTLSGLSGSVTLANNGGDSRTLSANGAFTFATALASGAAYSVTVTTQPATQTCTVASGAGTVTAGNVASITVTCATKTFTVGGSVSGLTGTGLVLRNNGGDDLARAADGAFVFATPVTSGGAYNVSVFTQPANPAQTCTPTNNTGTVAANVTSVTITCVTPPPTAGTAVIGPAGGTVNGAYGAQIIVPAGALATPVTIGLARAGSDSPVFAAPDIDAVGAIYELTPHGQTFSLPVKVRIPFDPEQVYNDVDPQIYKAEVAGAFNALPTTVNGSFLESSVTNFSWVMPTARASRPRVVYALRNLSGSADLAAFRIDRVTGALSAPISTALTGDFPTSVVVHPSGRFAYVTNAGSTTLNGIAPNSVSQYGLNTISGKLLATGALPVATRAPADYKPTMPVVHPAGTFLYVINFGRVSFNGGGDIDVFAIQGSKGTLTLTGAAISGGGAQPMGIVFNRLGTRAYVLYAGSESSNPLSSKIALYNVDAATGAFQGPVSTFAAGALGSNPWSIAIDPNGKALYVACLSTNELLSYSINSGSGALSSLGSSLAAQDRPASLAADSFGRFIFAAKQDPLRNVNTLSFSLNAASGALTAANSQLSACPSGGCVGPISVITEPQGDFVYVVDSVGGLTTFAVNQQTGALTGAGSRTGAWVPGIIGVGIPFTFDASGTSPVWQPNCTTNCRLAGVIERTSSGGSPPPTLPSPLTSHNLSVTQPGAYGYVTSTPAGIDLAPSSSSDPLGRNVPINRFPANSNVQMCASPPASSGGAYDITWGGSCSGNGQCASVTMTSDKSCSVRFSTPLPGSP